MVVSDISCDINGSIEFLDRTCTIDKPFFTYNPLTRHEVCADISSDGITVMGTDILPAELPRESSDHFGTAVVQVLSELVDFQTLRNDEEASSTHVTIDLQNATPLLVRNTFYTLQQWTPMTNVPLALFYFINLLGQCLHHNPGWKVGTQI